MHRRLSTLFFAVSVLMWIVAVGIYIRSRFRADAITCITPWHHCILIEDDEGLLTIYDESSWPGVPTLQWTTGVPYLNPGNSRSSDTLLGPLIQWHIAGKPAHSWWRLGVQHDSTLQFGSMIDCQLRDGWFWSGDPTRLPRTVVYGAWAPTWLPPTVLAIPPLLWLLAEGRCLYRVHSRRGRGLCLRCGYDLRHTPSRCPECGVQVVNKHPSEID